MYLQSAKSEAEEEIYRQINLKIDEFFELGQFVVILRCMFLYVSLSVPLMYPNPTISLMYYQYLYVLSNTYVSLFVPLMYPNPTPPYSLCITITFMYSTIPLYTQVLYVFIYPYPLYMYAMP